MFQQPHVIAQFTNQFRLNLAKYLHFIFTVSLFFINFLQYQFATDLFSIILTLIKSQFRLTKFTVSDLFIIMSSTVSA